MIGKASKKVAGGKMLRIEIDYDDKIKRVILSGDFFMHPEEAITVIEKSIENISIKETNSFIKNVLDSAVARNKIQLIGFATSDIAEALKEAMI